MAPRLPAGDQAMQIGGRGGALDALAQAGVAQQLGDLGEDFQVLLRGGLGHQQEDQQADRLFVRGIEADRLRQAQHGGHRRLQTLDAAMRNGHAMAQAGGAQPFTREQAVGDQRTRQAMQALEQQAGLFERAFLAGGLNADEDLGLREDGCETVHGSGRELCAAGLRGATITARNRCRREKCTRNAIALVVRGHGPGAWPGHGARRRKRKPPDGVRTALQVGVYRIHFLL